MFFWPSSNCLDGKKTNKKRTNLLVAGSVVSQFLSGCQVKTGFCENLGQVLYLWSGCFRFLKYSKDFVCMSPLKCAMMNSVTVTRLGMNSARLVNVPESVCTSFLSDGVSMSIIARVF